MAEIISSGVLPTKHSVQAFVVYDKTTGDVVFMHNVVVFEGAETPAEPEIEAAARRRLDASGADALKIAVLKVDARKVDADARYRVDVAKQSLVKMKRRPG